MLQTMFKLNFKVFEFIPLVFKLRHFFWKKKKS